MCLCELVIDRKLYVTGYRKQAGRMIGIHLINTQLALKLIGLARLACQ